MLNQGPKEALLLVITILNGPTKTGGLSKLARTLNINRVSVHEWIKRGRVPAMRVLQVSAAVDGKVTPTQLRPDLYPLETARP